MTFDKICRGSLIGEAHKQGLYVAPDSSMHRHSSSRQLAESRDDWYERNDYTRQVNKRADCVLSPRWQRGARGRGPAPAPKKTQFISRDGGNVNPIVDDRASPRQSGRRRSEGVVSAAEFESNAPVSPTYRNSEKWMMFSAPRDNFRLDQKEVKRESRNNLIDPPETHVIANSVNGLPTKGKKQMPLKSCDAQRLLRQDDSYPVERRSVRKHNFDDTNGRSAHRISQEVADAFKWSGVKKEEEVRDMKVIIGDKVKNVEVSGRRSGKDIGTGHHFTGKVAGASPRVHIKDHHNSDNMRAHLAHHECKVKQPIATFNSGSTINAGLPRTFSFARSLNVQPYHGRALGLFSPSMPQLFNPPPRTGP